MTLSYAELDLIIHTAAMGSGALPQGRDRESIKQLLKRLKGIQHGDA